MQRGLIENVELGWTKDKREYRYVQLDGQTTSLFDKKYFSHLRHGLEIEYAAKRSADCRWWNLSEFGIPGVDLEKPEDGGSPGERGWRQKCRSFGMEYATRILAESELDAEERYRRSFRYADGYYMHNMNGEKPNEGDGP